MEQIKPIQASIKQTRDACALAENAYYQALQQWAIQQRAGSATPAIVAEVEKLWQDRVSARKALQTALARLADGGDPQVLIEQVPANIPFLLLPVRIEARYITFRHVVRGLSPEHILDLGDDKSGTNVTNAEQFQVDDEGQLTYQAPALHRIGRAQIKMRVENGTLKPASGKFIRRRNDRKELWIRIYPDDISLETHEQYLLPAEWEMGKAFWQKIWEQADPETAWLELSRMATPPRGAWIVRSTRPENYTPGANLSTAPVFRQPLLKEGVYTLPPVARLLPDRFVARLYKGDQYKEFTGRQRAEPLLTGLDPTDDPFDTKESAGGFVPDGAGLKAPEYLRWMFDLETAEKAGMAIRIDLKQYPQFETGVDRIIVLGAGLDADAAEGERLLNAHLENHLYKESGLGILPQGTPTNDSGGQKSGYNRREEAARAYYRSEFSGAAEGPLQADETFLRQLLGLPDAPRLPNGHLTDIQEALMMNSLLWPATWGYYLLQFFTPELSESKRETLRQFFVHHVSGRGMLPTLHINKQPYGIVPTTSFRHWKYAGTSDEAVFLTGLWTQFLSALDTQWQAMSQNIHAASNSDTSGQRLDASFLKMIGHNASSVRWSRQWLAGPGLQDMIKVIQNSSSLRLNSDPRYKPTTRQSELQAAKLNEKLFKTISYSYSSNLQDIREVLLDGRSLLEEDHPLERLAGKAWNYLEWLAQGKLLEIWNDVTAGVPIGEGHPDSKAAASLFARFARQAVLRTYLETGLRVVEPNPGLWLLKAKDFELEHLHTGKIKITKPGNLGLTNKLYQLYKPVIEHFKLQAAIELEPDRRQYFNKKYPKTGQFTLAEWLDQSQQDLETKPIREIKAILDHFSRVPVTRLERLFTEHLDLCSYRLDAWMTGLVSQRLSKQRQSAPRGIHLGAFGYLLNLKPNPKRAVVVVETEPELIPAAPENIELAALPVVSFSDAIRLGVNPVLDTDRIFFYLGEASNPGLRLQVGMKRVEPAPALNEVKSNGFLHLPSLAHASTAAIMKAGYLSHKAEDENSAQAMAVNLNAPRVRQAMKLIEGMQQGAPLPELLGYHLERLLHERGLDGFLLDFRRKFPLERTSNENQPASPLTTTNGLKLLEAWRNHPTTWLAGVPGISQKTTAINAVVKELDDHFDALADLLLSESIYQTVKGNPDRAAAALRTLNSGGQAITPEFIHPMAQGRTITHRVGIVFEPVTAVDSAVWTVQGSLRSRLSPALNRWLSRQLPTPNRVAIALKNDDGTQYLLKLTDLEIEPIDLIYACPETFRSMESNPLTLFIQHAAWQKLAIPVDRVQIDFESRSGFDQADFSIFEISSMIAALNKIIQSARHIAANDFQLPEVKASSGVETIDAMPQYRTFQDFIENGDTFTVLQALRNQTATLRAAVANVAPDETIRHEIAALLSGLRQTWLLGYADAALPGVSSALRDQALLVAEKAEKAALDLEARLEGAQSMFAAISPDLVEGNLFKAMEEVAQLLFGKRLRLMPAILPDNVQAVKSAYEGRSLVENTAPDLLDEWLREAALTRAPLGALRQAVLLREVFLSADSHKTPIVLQFPFKMDKPQPWIGGPLPATTEDQTPLEAEPSLSLLLETPETLRLDSALTGFILDEWPETIPFKNMDTGVAFQYNQPNTEPPQALLLAVSPEENENWKWEHLMGAVSDALEMSKKRMVTPSEIAAHNAGLAQVLPALTLPFMAENRNVPVVPVPN